MAEYFNHPEPFMFNATSFDNEKSLQQDMVEITQHLAPEQFSYEFPPKSCIVALEANDNPDEFSFFDECSFTSNSTAAFMYQDDDDEDVEDYNNADELLDQYLDSFHSSSIVADNQLSPLQLPAQIINRPIREESCDSNGTIVIRKPSYQPARPSSFLSSPHKQQHTSYLNTVNEEDRINWDETSFIFPDYSTHQNVYTSIHPFSRRNSYVFQSDNNEDDLSSNCSSQSKVVFMKINKNHVAPPTFIHYSHTAGSYISTDEGYDDDDDEENCKELPIESASFFLPLSDDPRESAAIKIQSVWRGYQSRKQMGGKVTHRVLAGLAHINDTIHRRNYNQLNHQHEMLQKQLDKETAMRMAFEKTMEDMTILMDHQHSVLHERLEQEVKMRQTYERKMDQTVAQIQPLEARIRHEAKARADMESMMSRVIDQLQGLRLQVKEQAEQKNVLQQQLDQANDELKKLKRPSSRLSTTTKVRSSVTPNRTTTRTTTPSSRTTTPSSRTTTPSSRTTTPSSRTTISNKTTPTSRTTTTTTTRNNTVSRLSTRSRTLVTNKK